MNSLVFSFRETSEGRESRWVTISLELANGDYSLTATQHRLRGTDLEAQSEGVRRDRFSRPVFNELEERIAADRPKDLFHWLGETYPYLGLDIEYERFTQNQTFRARITYLEFLRQAAAVGVR